MKLGNETFKFSPRVDLIMANIKTIREIVRIIEGEEGRREFKRLVDYIEDYLHNLLPQNWIIKREENKILIYSDQWRVNDKYIAIVADFSRGVKPLGGLNIAGDPWVGLFVPDWKYRERFNKELINELSQEFSEWERPEKEWPIWTWIKYEVYGKGDTFDTQGFINELKDKIIELLRIKDRIDNILGKIRNL